MTALLSIHPDFSSLFVGAAPAQKIANQCLWTEGPVYLPQEQALLWSDIPNNRTLRWDQASGQVSVDRSPAHYANGHTLDRQGRLVSCEHGSRSVTRREHDGRTTVLASHDIDGLRLNSPNDVVVACDGSIWFTDPTYGIDSDYEGHRADSEIGASHVYCISTDLKKITRVCDDFVRPNGLAFNKDESRLYVSDTGKTHFDNGPHHIRVFNVGAHYALTDGQVFADCDVGLFDGFRVDALGRVWTSAGDGVHCYAASGALLGKVLLRERAANLVFGGPDGCDLFVCASSSVYRVRMAADWTSAPASLAMASAEKPI